jgi:hypothetical protein
VRLNNPDALPGPEQNQARRNIPEAEEEGADTDGYDEQVEEDDQLGVVAPACQVGGTLQPGRRHIQAQRHLLHGGLRIYTSFEIKKVAPTLIRGLEACLSVLEICDIMVQCNTSD